MIMMDSASVWECLLFASIRLACGQVGYALEGMRFPFVRVSAVLQRTMHRLW